MTVSQIERSDSYLDHCMDIDSDEMAPMHMWPEIFGESAAEILELAQTLKILSGEGPNTVNRSDLSADDLPINEETIWTRRGATLNFASENYLAAMILGGVFERHPTLCVGSIETGAQWVGPLAERLDLWASQFSARIESTLSMKPSEYVNRQFRAMPFFFENVASYFERYPHLSDVYAFSTDYPHVEGGQHTKSIFSKNLQNCSEALRRKFFRDNGAWLLPT